MQTAGLIELAATLAPNTWHEITKIRDATAYLVRATPQQRDFDIHDDVDEFVIVLKGEFPVETPAGKSVTKAGQSLLVPRGTPHRARVTDEAIIVLIR